MPLLGLLDTYPIACLIMLRSCLIACLIRFGVVDLYRAINGRRDGLMSCSELAAGLEWLGALIASDCL